MQNVGRGPGCGPRRLHTVACMDEIFFKRQGLGNADYLWLPRLRDREDLVAVGEAKSLG